MDTLRATWEVLRESFSGLGRRIHNKKLLIETQCIGAAATNKQREEKEAAQLRCGLYGHNYVHVYGSESHGEKMPDFEICQRCQKIHGVGQEDRIPVWDLERYLTADAAYPAANRPEEELYSMPLEELKALAEATR